MIVFHYSSTNLGQPLLELPAPRLQLHVGLPQAARAGVAPEVVRHHGPRKGGLPTISTTQLSEFHLKQNWLFVNRWFVLRISEM